MPPSAEPPAKKVRVLILGFGSEGTFNDNISEQTLKALANRFGRDGFEVITRVIPVDPDLSRTQTHLRQVFKDTHPDVIIPMGQNGDKKLVDELKNNPATRTLFDRPFIAYTANAENRYDSREQGSSPQVIEPGLPKHFRRHVFFTPDLIPFNPAVVKVALKDSRASARRNTAPDWQDAGDGQGYVVVDPKGKEYIGNYLCNLVLYESQRWQDQQEKTNHPVLVTPFVHLLNPYGTPEKQEKFVRYYADHVEILVRRAAAIEEVKLINTNPNHPHYEVLLASSTDTPEKAIISAMQYQLFKQGFLKKTEENPCPVDGIYSQETYDALMRFAAYKKNQKGATDKGWLGYGHALDEIIEYGKNMRVSQQQVNDMLKPQEMVYVSSAAETAFSNSNNHLPSNIAHSARAGR